MLGCLRDRPLSLAQRALRCFGRLGQRTTERIDEKPIGFLVECERGGLTRVADDAAGRGRETLEVLGFAAAGARGQVRLRPVLRAA